MPHTTSHAALSQPLPRHVLVDSVLLASFFLSGCSALIYQSAWQRSLYGVIGVDTDSITVIVSVFMLGIGLGGMLGGWLADRQPSRRLRWYALAELGLALYGALSLGLLHHLEITLASWSWDHATLSALACMVFLLLPTTLMGMTLPLLTMAFNERHASIGVSVGQLYFVNTLGAATGAALVPLVLLPLWPLSQVVHGAVVGNIVVALCAIFTVSRPLRTKQALACNV